MRPNALILALLILSACVGPARAGGFDELEASYSPRMWEYVSWRAHLRSTAYAFESIDDEGSVDHVGIYQHFDGSVSNLSRGRLSLRIAGRFANDLGVGPRQTDRERLYVGYAQWKTSKAAARARIGRQFIQEGPTHLTLDGAWMKLSPSRPIELRVFAGSRAPASRIYEPGDFGEETAAGARIVYRHGPRLNGAVSFAYLERNALVSAKPLGLELRAMPMKGLRTLLRASYETEGKEWDRGELSAQWRRRESWPVFSLHLLDRRPSIAADSWFKRFDVERIRIVRTSARQLFENRFGVELELFGAVVDTRESARVAGSFIFPYGKLGYSVRIGDSGEESSWVGDVGHSLLPWLHASVGAMISTYALMEDAPAADERDLVTAFGRLRAQLHSGLRLGVELQSVDDPIYSEDFRLLIGLDVVAASDESSYGISRKGWLQ